MDLDADAEILPSWPGRAPRTPEEGLALWDAYLRSIEERTDLRSRILESQSAHALDTMHVYKRVADLERNTAELQRELSELRKALKHVEGWVAAHGVRLATIVYGSAS